MHYLTALIRSYTFYAAGETRSITSHITYNTKKHDRNRNVCNGCNCPRRDFAQRRNPEAAP